MKRLTLVILSLFFVATISRGQAVELVLGDPSPDLPTSTKSTGAAGNSVNNYPSGNIRVDHTNYVLSFNPSRLTSDWVSWHVQQSDLGNSPRPNSFRPDPLLPKNLQVSGNSLGSTYDRGHMCPDADRSKNKIPQSETYFMSNMQPQHKDLNRIPWKNLEVYIRNVVKQGNEAYIYAGCAGGTTKLPNGMTIPSHCWKIVTLLPFNKDDLKRVSSTTRVIAVDMPNDSSAKTKDWPQYRTTVKAIEAETGLDFFKTVKNDVSISLKSTPDTVAILKAKVNRKKKIVKMIK